MNQRREKVGKGNQVPKSEVIEKRSTTVQDAEPTAIPGLTHTLIGNLNAGNVGISTNVEKKVLVDGLKRAIVVATKEANAYKAIQIKEDMKAIKLATTKAKKGNYFYVSNSYPEYKFTSQYSKEYMNQILKMVRSSGKKEFELGAYEYASFVG